MTGPEQVDARLATRWLWAACILMAGVWEPTGTPTTTLVHPLAPMDHTQASTLGTLPRLTVFRWDSLLLTIRQKIPGALQHEPTYGQPGRFGEGGQHARSWVWPDGHGLRRWGFGRQHFRPHCQPGCAPACGQLSAFARGLLLKRRKRRAVGSTDGWFDDLLTTASRVFCIFSKLFHSRNTLLFCNVILQTRSDTLERMDAYTQVAYSSLNSAWLLPIFRDACCCSCCCFCLHRDVDRMQTGLDGNLVLAVRV